MSFYKRGTYTDSIANFIILVTDNKAIGIVRPGHIFTIEPMICEGVYDEVLWYWKKSNA